MISIKQDGVGQDGYLVWHSQFWDAFQFGNESAVLVEVSPVDEQIGGDPESVQKLFLFEVGHPDFLPRLLFHFGTPWPFPLVNHQVVTQEQLHE